MAGNDLDAWLTDENDNPKKFTKANLQVYLRERNLPTTGTKQQLLIRVRGAQKLAFDDVVHGNARDEVRDSERHRQRLLTPLGENLPDPCSLTGWISDCASFPMFTDKEMYNFLVLNRNTFDHEAVSAKKELGKAQVFYDDGHVQSVQYHDVNDKSSHCFIKCQCLPSFPGSSASKKPAYNVWICLSKVTGRVHSANCNCVAGLGEACNHIAALMTGLVDITRRRSEGKLAPTSMACSWIKPRQRHLSPKKSTEISFAGRSSKSTTTGDESSSTTTKPSGPYGRLRKTDNTLEQYSRFRSSLTRINSKAGWLKNFVSDNQTNEDFSEQEERSIPQLHNIDRTFRDGVDLKHSTYVGFFRSYKETLSLSSKECVKIFDVTLGQSSNDLWFDARFGRITASVFGSVVRRKPTTPPDNLLKLLLGYQVPYQGKPVHHGLQYEQRARDDYQLVVKGAHPPLKVQDCGLCVNHSWPYLGASPDGLCVCEHCDISEGLLEIKCPWKFRHVTPHDAARSENFFCYVKKDGTLKLRRSHAYYYQVQGQMGITGRRWCDFVIWTFKGISIERIMFDAECWQTMFTKLENFYVNALLPELFSQRVKRGKKLFPLVP